MNRTVIVGRLTKDPELRYTQSNKAVVGFTVAVNRQFTNSNGEREADFIKCIVWGKQAENLARYMKKGQQLGVDGRLQSRNYQANDGSRKYITELVAESVQYLESKNNNSNDLAPQQQTYNQQPAANDTKKAIDDFANFGANIDISDDDLPF